MSRRHGQVAAATLLVLAVALLAVGRLGGSEADPTDAFDARCPDPALTTAQDRTWNDGAFVVDQDMWNNHGGSQTLRACSYHLWSVTAVQSDTPDVNTYPNVHRDFDEPSLDTFSEISSTFAASGPGRGVYEFAYDVWLNGVATPGSTEIMVWTDHHGSTPNVPQRGTFTSGGLPYRVYRGGHFIAFLGPNRSAGEVDLLAFFRYAVARGWLGSSATVGQIDFGVEICSTEGAALGYTVTDFSLVAR